MDLAHDRNHLQTLATKAYQRCQKEQQGANEPSAS